MVVKFLLFFILIIIIIMIKELILKKVLIQEKVVSEEGMETLLFFPRILGTMGGSNHMIFADESA
jgi:hypothetical protein